MANEKTGVLQFQLADGTYVAGYPKTTLSQVIGGQDAIDKAKDDAVKEALEKAGVKTYTAGESYHANALVADGSNLYLVMKDFTATAAEADVSAGNMVLINSSSVTTSSSDAFMTTAEVDALFDTTAASSTEASS